MTLNELVDELRNNILNDRSDAISGDPDQLWTDATLVRYINEAQRRFATRGLVIRDSSTREVVNVTLVDGQSEYELHPSIIAVISARMSDSAADLARFGHSALNGPCNASSMTWYPSAVTVPAGRPLMYSTDEALAEDDDGTFNTVVMRVHPTPDADSAGGVIKLRVIRKPLDDLTASDMYAVPEIPIDYHLAMLDWAAHLALRINDVDAGNDTRAELFRASFEQSVKEARNLILRKIFVPQQWGFGRGGWAWDDARGGY